MRFYSLRRSLPIIGALTLPFALATGAIAQEATETTDEATPAPTEGAELEAAESDTDADDSSESDAEASEGEGGGGGEGDTGGPLEATTEGGGGGGEGDTGGPLETAETPAAETPAPVAEEPAPVAEEPAPVAEEPAKKRRKRKDPTAVETTPADGNKTTDTGVTADAKPAKEASKDSKGDNDGDAGGAPAAMAAGGVVGGSSFPVGVTATLTNSLGTGTFAPGYSNNPSLVTALTVRPVLRIPKLVDWQPSMMISGSLPMDIEWFSSFTGTPFAGPADRQIRIRDASAAFIMPGLLSESFTGLSVTPIAVVRAPLSVSSRFNQRLIGGTLAAQAQWGKAFPYVGAFFAQYVPAITGWSFLNNAPTLPCGQDYPAGGGLIPGNDLQDGTSTLPLAVGRLEEVDQNGQCRIQGRQIIGSISNSIGGGWSPPAFLGTHTFSGSAAILHSIFRPLENNEETRSQFAQPQSLVNVFPWHSFTLTYTYGVPVDFMTAQISGGVTSFQPFFDSQNQVRSPFDFNIQGGNNFTQGFVSFTVGI